MADDKSRTGGPDRSRVAGGEDYEVHHFANRHGISAEQAKALIATYGNNREKLDQAASRLSGNSRKS